MVWILNAVTQIAAWGGGHAVIAESGMGKGLKAYMPIKNGAIIGTFLGELKKTPPNNPSYIMEAEKGFYIDAKMKGNLIRFINHSCSPNCEAVN